MAIKKRSPVPKPKPTMDSKLAKLNQQVDANMNSLAHITDVLAETMSMSELIADYDYSPDSSFAMQLAAANAQILECAKEAANMAHLLIYVKQEINKL